MGRIVALGLGVLVRRGVAVGLGVFDGRGVVVGRMVLVGRGVLVASPGLLSRLIEQQNEQNSKIPSATAAIMLRRLIDFITSAHFSYSSTLTVYSRRNSTSVL